MQNPLANFIGVFSLVRDDRGFQVNPLCRHDITSPFPPSGNRGYVRYVRNLDGLLNQRISAQTVRNRLKEAHLHARRPHRGLDLTAIRRRN